jgi:hypothetical protein
VISETALTLALERNRWQNPAKIMRSLMESRHFQIRQKFRYLLLNKVAIESRVGLQGI